MKSQNLLRNQYTKSSKKTKRHWVKDLLPNVDVPFTYLEFDIKFLWVAGKNKNVLVLTVIDAVRRCGFYSLEY